MVDSDSDSDEPPSETREDEGDSLDFSTYNLPTDLTAFQTNLVCVVNQLGPAEGVNLQEALEEMYPEPINHGRLYPGLDRLVEKGLITKQTKESDKRRKEYAVTGRGEWVVEEYLRFVQDMAE